MANKTDRIEFTKEMKKTHTILVPNMSPVHFTLLKKVLTHYGYNVDILSEGGKNVLDAGLKYVHNDICYPCLICTGQFISAIESGKYDPDKIALMMVQTGGGCRASNYISVIRKALKNAGYGNIPVISANVSGLEKNSGVAITPGLIQKAFICICYGDMLMEMYHQTKPFETIPGSSKKLLDNWLEKAGDIIIKRKWHSRRSVSKDFDDIVRAFSSLEMKKREVIKVGIVGEIYVKYSSVANNMLEEFLYSQGCQVVVPGILPYLHYAVDNRSNDVDYYGGKIIIKYLALLLGKYLSSFENMIGSSISKYSNFSLPDKYKDLKEAAEGIISVGCKMGEGWILTAEMIHLIKSGVPNVICTQPFGCLPNHIVGKGMMKQISEKYNNANIVSIDYDPGASKVNQENRIKLMLSTAMLEFTKKCV
ncbi:MAG: 2-hydroxyglutaryl-CoA dehydratase [Clostridiales bacterium]|nr:2-hydroxyglutaryl-CoA dehydratase [Clostridiales bacterium]